VSILSSTSIRTEDNNDDGSKMQPISEATIAPSTSTDITNRTFGTPRNVVLLIFLIILVTNSILSSSLYKTLAYVPDTGSQQNQMNVIIMTAATKQANTEIIVTETAPNRKSLVEALAELDSLSPMECSEGFVRINDTHIPENLNDPTRKIPKIVFQTSRSRCITPRLYELTTRWRFKGWSYYFYDDNAIMRLFHEESEEFPHLKLLTRCIDYGTIKADLWRYLILWKYGGLYADLDSVPTSKFTVNTIKPMDDSLFVVESYYLLSQYFMSLSPKHPLMYYSLQRSLFKLLEATDTGKFNAALLTGPHALHAGFTQFMKDAGVKVREPMFEPVSAGLFVGTNNRSARAIGKGGRKESNQYVVREEIGPRAKMADYKKMNMTHNQQDKNTPSGHSCFSALYQEFINNEKKEMPQ
jgi:mannosyltransferase OCH1-like enzyme